MQTLTLASVEQHYSAALASLCEIARNYTTLGKISDALQVLNLAQELLATGEVSSQHRLKLLIQTSKTLIIAQLEMRTDADQVLATIEQAKQVAEALQDQQAIADAMSMLGQALYFSVVLNSGVSGDPLGKYHEALAYHEQALEIRSSVHDTRGIGESHFCIGNIYERWQQVDVALEHYTRARQIADQYGHLYERTEPTRHLALLALQRQDLDQALVYAQQTLSFREEANFRPFLPLDHILLSSITLAKGETDQALTHAQQALTLAREMDNKGTLTFALLNLGDIQMAQNEGQQAQVSYESGLMLARELQAGMLITRANASLQRAARQRTDA